MLTVYAVWESWPHVENGKLCGLYSTREGAEKAVVLCWIACTNPGERVSYRMMKAPYDFVITEELVKE